MFAVVFVKLLSWLGVSSGWGYLATFTFGYLFGVVYLSPDVDSRSSPFHNWGLFRGIWIPYQRLGRHRGSSHTVTGSVLRMAYFGVFLTVFLLAVGVGIGGLSSYLRRNTWYVLVFLFGGFLASLQHILMDRLSTGYKRLK